MCRKYFVASMGSKKRICTFPFDGHRSQIQEMLAEQRGVKLPKALDTEPQDTVPTDEYILHITSYHLICKVHVFDHKSSKNKAALCYKTWILFVCDITKGILWCYCQNNKQNTIQGDMLVQINDEYISFCVISWILCVYKGVSGLLLLFWGGGGGLLILFACLFVFYHTRLVWLPCFASKMIKDCFQLIGKHDRH